MLCGRIAALPPCADDILARTLPCHDQIGRQAERFGDRRGARTLNRITADHIDGGGRIAQRLRRLRDGSHFHIDGGKLIERHLLQGLEGLPVRCP